VRLTGHSKTNQKDKPGFSKKPGLFAVTKVPIQKRLEFFKHTKKNRNYSATFFTAER
jgi:hypothetical protein